MAMAIMAMAMLLMMGGDAQGLPRPGMRTGNAMGMVLYNTPKGTTTSPGFAVQRQQHSAAQRSRQTQMQMQVQTKPQWQ